MTLRDQYNKNIALSSLLLFLTLATVVLCRYAANILLISHYQENIFPYFYLAFPWLIILVSSLLFKQENKKQLNFIVLYSQLLALLAAVFCIQLNFFAAPFIISIFLYTIIFTLPIIIINLVQNIFDIVTFKKIGSYLFGAGSLGALAASLLIKVTLQEPIAILIAAFALLSAALIIYSKLSLSKRSTLKSKKFNSKHYQPTLRSILTNPYLAALTAYMISVILIFMFTDYLMKVGLADVADISSAKQALATIITLSQLIILLFQLALVNKIINWIGSTNLVFIFPLVVLAASLFTAYYQSFVAIACLYILCDVTYYSFNNLTRTFFLNVLPPIVKNFCRFFLDGQIRAIAIISSSLIMLIITNLNTITTSLAIITLCCFIAIFIAAKMSHLYIEELKKQVYQKKFKSSEALLGSTESSIERFNLAMGSNNADIITHALKQQLKLKLEYTPPQIEKLFKEQSNCQISTLAAQLLLQADKNITHLQLAERQLLSSEHFDVRLTFAQYLLKSPSENTYYNGQLLFDRVELADKHLGAYILCQIGTLEEKSASFNFLYNQSKAENKQEILYFLKVLTLIDNGENSHLIKRFLVNNDHEIFTLVLSSLPQKHRNDLCEILLTSLKAQRHIIPILDFLRNAEQVYRHHIALRINEHLEPNLQDGLIQTIAQNPAIDNEQLLINIYQDNSDFLIQIKIIKALAYRAQRLRLSNKTLKHLRSVLENTFAIYCYTQTLSLELKPLQQEVTARALLIKTKLLYGLAAAEQSIIILNVMPSLLSVNGSIPAHAANAIELSEASLSQRRHKQILLATVNKSQIEPIDNLSAITSDKLLTKIINNPQMINTTVANLRKSQLFSNLALEQLLALEKIVRSNTYAKGSYIIKQGEAGSHLYIIDKGTVDVIINNKTVGQMTAGHHFGELALLANVPRKATIKANSEATLYIIDKVDFDKLTNNVPQILKMMIKQIASYYFTGQQHG